MSRWGLAVVRGQSMEPSLADGDRLLVRHGGSARAGVVAVVVLPDGVVAVKRLAFADSAGWWVQRDNPIAGVDSWSVGAIPAADVRAVAACVVWPPRGMLRWLRSGRGTRRA